MTNPPTCRTLIQFLTVVGLLLYGISPGQSQCDTRLNLVQGKDSIRFAGLWQEAQTSFQDFILLTSPAGGTFELQMGRLQDPNTRKILSGEEIQLSASSITIAQGKSTEISISIKSIPQPGVYQGALIIYGEEDGCRWDIPITVDMKREGQVAVLELDKKLAIKVVSPSWMNGLVPRKIRHAGLNFRVENTGNAPVQMKDYSLSLKGKATEQVITSADVVWQNADKSIPAGGLEVVSFKLNPQDRLEADQYEGQLRLYFEDYLSPLSVSVSMSTRIGVSGAILILLLGIIVGRVMKDVNESQDQIELMDQYIPLRAKVDQLKHEGTRDQLTKELLLIEAEINKVANADGRPAVEAKLKQTATKVEHMITLEGLQKQLEEEMAKDASADFSDVEEAIKEARDLIHEGEEEAIQSSFKEIKDLLLGEDDSSSKGGLGEDEFDEKGVAPREESPKDKIDDKKEETAKDITDTFWQKSEKWFFRILSIISGIKVTARVRYGLFRPLVSLATFVVIVLIGFQEIYIKGGDTFGMEGIYDYLKLFLWGVVSDVFSRTLTGGTTQAFLKGKP